MPARLPAATRKSSHAAAARAVADRAAAARVLATLLRRDPRWRLAVTKRGSGDGSVRFCVVSTIPIRTLLADNPAACRKLILGMLKANQGLRRGIRALLTRDTPVAPAVLNVAQAFSELMNVPIGNAPTRPELVTFFKNMLTRYGISQPRPSIS